jgi:hypothetical protein
MAPASIGIGQFPEACPSALRDVVLLAAVDEYLSLRHGLTGLVDDPDIDGASGCRMAEEWKKEPEGE